MRGELSERSQVDLLNTCTESVKIMTDNGYIARVGKNGKMSYPAVKKGVWTAALLLDTGSGWACPLYDAINAPHWDWFLATNMEMFDIAVATGLCFGLLGDGKSSEKIALTLEYILMDPCRIPNNNCSPNFQCLECDLDWQTKVPDIGTSGRGFNLEYSLYPEKGSLPPQGWDEDTAKLLFGEKDFMKSPANSRDKSSN